MRKPARETRGTRAGLAARGWRAASNPGASERAARAAPKGSTSAISRPFSTPEEKLLNRYITRLTAIATARTWSTSPQQANRRSVRPSAQATSARPARWSTANATAAPECRPPKLAPNSASRLSPVVAACTPSLAGGTRLNGIWCTV